MSSESEFEAVLFKSREQEQANHKKKSHKKLFMYFNIDISEIYLLRQKKKRRIEQNASISEIFSASDNERSRRPGGGSSRSSSIAISHKFYNRSRNIKSDESGIQILYPPMKLSRNHGYHRQSEDIESQVSTSHFISSAKRQCCPYCMTPNVRYDNPSYLRKTSAYHHSGHNGKYKCGESSAYARKSILSDLIRTRREQPTATTTIINQQDAQIQCNFDIATKYDRHQNFNSHSVTSSVDDDSLDSQSIVYRTPKRCVRKHSDYLIIHHPYIINNNRRKYQRRDYDELDKRQTSGAHCFSYAEELMGNNENPKENILYPDIPFKVRRSINPQRNSKCHEKYHGKQAESISLNSKKQRDSHHLDKTSQRISIGGEKRDFVHEDKICQRNLIQPNRESCRKSQLTEAQQLVYEEYQKKYSRNSEIDDENQKKYRMSSGVDDENQKKYNRNTDVESGKHSLKEISACRRYPTTGHGILVPPNGESNRHTQLSEAQQSGKNSLKEKNRKYPTSGRYGNYNSNQYDVRHPSDEKSDDEQNKCHGRKEKFRQYPTSGPCGNSNSNEYIMRHPSDDEQQEYEGKACKLKARGSSESAKANTTATKSDILYDYKSGEEYKEKGTTNRNDNRSKKTLKERLSGFFRRNPKSNSKSSSKSPNNHSMGHAGFKCKERKSPPGAFNIRYNASCLVVRNKYRPSKPRKNVIAMARLNYLQNQYQEAETSTTHGYPTNYKERRVTKQATQNNDIDECAIPSLSYRLSPNRSTNSRIKDPIKKRRNSNMKSPKKSDSTNHPIIVVRNEYESDMRDPKVIDKPQSIRNDSPNKTDSHFSASRNQIKAVPSGSSNAYSAYNVKRTRPFLLADPLILKSNDYVNDELEDPCEVMLNRRSSLKTELLPTQKLATPATPAAPPTEVTGSAGTKEAIPISISTHSVDDERKKQIEFCRKLLNELDKNNPEGKKYAENPDQFADHKIPLETKRSVTLKEDKNLTSSQHEEDHPKPKMLIKKQLSHTKTIPPSEKKKIEKPDESNRLRTNGVGSSSEADKNKQKRNRFLRKSHSNDELSEPIVERLKHELLKEFELCGQINGCCPCPCQTYQQQCGQCPLLPLSAQCPPYPQCLPCGQCSRCPPYPQCSPCSPCAQGPQYPDMNCLCNGLQISCPVPKIHHDTCACIDDCCAIQDANILRSMRMHEQQYEAEFNCNCLDAAELSCNCHDEESQCPECQCADQEDEDDNH